MKVKQLVFKNFRNIKQLQFFPEDRISFIVGKNGQGKTSILEGLGIISSLRSFRGNKIEETIQQNETYSEILCKLESEIDTELKVVLKKEENKTIKTAFINGKVVSKGSQYLLKRFGDFEIGFHCIVFNPSDHELIRGEPSNRRDYVDRVLAAEDPGYLNLLSRYNRVLEQRNRLLKNNEGIQIETLFGFTTALVETGAIIIQKRLSWMFNACDQVNFILKKIIPNAPEVRIHYLSKIFEKNVIEIKAKDVNDTEHFSGQSEVCSLDFLTSRLRDQARIHASAEIAAGTSLFGPQRDDWRIVFGDASLKSVGSQGEVRAVLIALKLSEIDLFRKATGHKPVLLLDDFSSELDRDRRQYLLDYLSKTDLQVFVTTTEEPNFSGSFFRLLDGVIEKQESQN